MRRLRLKFNPLDGFRIVPHPDLIATGVRPEPFQLPDVRMLSDVDTFNVCAMDHFWPELSGDGWQDEVRQALIGLEADSNPDAWRMMERLDITLMVMELLDGCGYTIEGALERVRAAGMVRP